MIKKAVVEDRLMDVIEIGEYHKSPSLYQPGYCAVEKDGLLYPLRKLSDDRPGYYPGQVVDFYKTPEACDRAKYEVGDNVIDFSNISNIRESVEAHNKLRDAESTLLSNVEVVYEPPLLEEDSPEMRAVKEAIILKQMDINKYEPRFGERFNNDKRLLKKGDITLMKLKTTCQALDIKATLILEDASPDVPNPMGRAIITEITSPDKSMDEEE